MVLEVSLMMYLHQLMKNNRDRSREEEMAVEDDIASEEEATTISSWLGSRIWAWIKAFIEGGYWWNTFGVILLASQCTVLVQSIVPSSTSDAGSLTVGAVERGCAFSNAVAFGSFWRQHKGLIGSQGLTPAVHIIHKAARRARKRKTWQEWWTQSFLPFPTIFWAIGGSDWALEAVCGGGFLLSLSLFWITLLPLPLWLEPLVSTWSWWMCGWLYLSLIHVSGDWLGLQSDSNTVEIDFLLGLCRLMHRPKTALVALRFFALRKMVGCGICKWYGSPMWQAQTAMTVHYFTQPLPNRWSFYAHHMPLWFHRFSVLMTFVIEVWLPYLTFVPWCRYVALCGFVGLLLAINTTGNYGFIGVLNLAENLSLTDDGWWRLVLQQSWASSWFSMNTTTATTSSSLLHSLWPNALLQILATTWRVAVALALVVYLAVSSVPNLSRASRGNFTAQDWWEAKACRWVLERLSDRWRDGILRLESQIHRLYSSQRSLRLCNYQGKFAGMHDYRWEPILEGSHDGAVWEQFKWKYKLNEGPNECGRVLPFHLPRLDWRIWFLPLYAKRGREPPEWYDVLLTKVLQGQPEVMALLREDPFRGQRPKFLRSRMVSFTFSSPTADSWWDTQELKFMTPLDRMIEANVSSDDDDSSDSHEKYD